MEYIQTWLSFEYLSVMINMLDPTFFSVSFNDYQIFPNEYQGRFWNGFETAIQEARDKNSTAEIYKQFLYMFLRVMAFMTFGFTLYDTAQVIVGQGSAAEGRGGRGRALMKNTLILVVAALTFEAETVINGIWEYLKSE